MTFANKIMTITSCFKHRMQVYPYLCKNKKRMNNIKNICVYSASSTKIAPIYFEAAEKLGQLLAQKHINLINGAGCLGLMCRISDAALAAGGTSPGSGGSRSHG